MQPKLDLQQERIKLLQSLSEEIQPGGGMPAVPYIQQFIAYYNTVYKVYLNPSEAYQMSREEADRMRNSAVVTEPLNSRKLSTALLSWHIECQDSHDPEQAEIATDLQHLIEETPDLLQMFLWLLDQGIWIGRGAIQLYYRWDFSQGKKQMKIGSWEPVQGDTIRFRYTDERVLILCMPYYVGRGTKAFDLDDLVPTDEARAYELSDWERQAFIVHKQGIEAAPFHHPEHAGWKHGHGVRDYIFYSWRLMQESLALLHTYLERVGLGQQIWRHQSGNAQQEAQMKRYAEAQHFNNILVIPGFSDQKFKDYEMIEPSGTGFESLKWVVQDYYGGIIRRFISGYSPFQQTGPQQQGGGGQEFNQDMQRKIMLYDSTCLADTLTRDLIRPMLQYNYPDCPYHFKFKFNVEKQSVDEYLKAVRGFYDLGGSVNEAEVRSKLGLTEPRDDDQVLQRPMTGLEGEGGLGEASEAKGDTKDPKGKGSKVEAIRAAINAMGQTAKAADIMAYLESNGIKASRSLVFNELSKLRGSTREEGQYKE